MMVTPRGPRHDMVDVERPFISRVGQAAKLAALAGPLADEPPRPCVHPSVRSSRECSASLGLENRHQRADIGQRPILVPFCVCERTGVCLSELATARRLGFGWSSRSFRATCGERASVSGSRYRSNTRSETPMLAPYLILARRLVCPDTAPEEDALRTARSFLAARRGSVAVQSGARRDGIAGIYGNLGIVESVTYRI